MEINSLSNAKVKQWAKYKEKKYRDQDCKFLIEGEHLIKEAQTAGAIECILIEQGKSCELTKYKTYEVTTDILRKLSDSTSGTWIMAVCHYPNAEKEVLGNHVIILDDVQDPGNVGTIIRTACSFGYDSVVLTNHCVDVYNEKVIRSTQGAIFHIPVIRGDIQNMIVHLKSQGVSIFATALQGATAMMQVPVPENIALIFGNEGKGIRDEILALADKKIFIEMHTFESLNVAVAAGICMYHYKK